MCYVSKRGESFRSARALKGSINPLPPPPSAPDAPPSGRLRNTFLTFAQQTQKVAHFYTPWRSRTRHRKGTRIYGPIVLEIPREAAARRGKVSIFVLTKSGFCGGGDSFLYGARRARSPLLRPGTTRGHFFQCVRGRRGSIALQTASDTGMWPSRWVSRGGFWAEGMAAVKKFDCFSMKHDMNGDKAISSNKNQARISMI